MATLYGVNADRILVDKPASHPKKGEQGGVVRMIRDEFELSADLVGGTDIILMGGLLPKGAKIVDVHLYADDLDAAGGTLDMGWQASAELDSTGAAVEAADVDGLFDELDVATAADCAKATDQAAAQLAKWMEKEFTADVQLVVSPSADTDAVVGTILVNVYYILD
jgi:hypothetical protein